MDYAVVNATTTVIENVVVLEEGAVWLPPEGTYIVPLVIGFGIDDTWNGTNFIRTLPPVLETTPGSAPDVIG